MDSYIAVDIGNSGLRMSLLDVEGRRLLATEPIYWKHSADVRDRLPGERRFLPGDPAWHHNVNQFVSAHVEMGQRVVWLVSSVRRDACSVLRHFVESGRDDDSLLEIRAAQVPLHVDVEYPEKLGIDRLLAALAASHVSAQRPLIVVQAGSAVTVDLLAQEASSQPAAFLGGAILPGVPMMLRLLGKAADMLPEIDADDLTDLPNLPGKNTEQAMLCGAASGLVGGVRHLVERYRGLLGSATPVVISGGDGMRLAPYIQPPILVESHLVQRGLLELATLHAAGKLPPGC